MNVFKWRLWISEDFLKTLKVKKLVWPWRLDIHARNMKREDFCFRSFISLSWVIGNTVLLKGVEEILRKNFQVMLNSNPTPNNPFERSHWKSHISSVNFFSDIDEDLLVSEEFVLTEELGIRQCGWPIHEEHDSPEKFDTSNPTVAVPRASCPKISYPPNGHIIEGHLCLIMSGCSLGYK